MCVTLNILSMLSVKKMPFFSNLPRFALFRDTEKKHFIGNISSILRNRDFKLRRLKITYFIDISLKFGWLKKMHFCGRYLGKTLLHYFVIHAVLEGGRSLKTKKFYLGNRMWGPQNGY